MTSTLNSSSPIDTGRVANRRALKFGAIDEALAEAERLAAAERAGTLKCLGNWSLGQALGHQACWAEYSYTGAPLKVPLPVKLVLRLRKNKFLRNPMPAGVRIPKVPGGTLATDPMALEAGLARFRAAFGRLRNEPPAMPNVIFGPLTHEQWIQLNLRHAELHLSFFEPASGG